MYLGDKVVLTARPELGIGKITQRYPSGFEVKFVSMSISATEGELQVPMKRAKQKKRADVSDKADERRRNCEHILTCPCEYCVRFLHFHNVNPHVQEFMLKEVLVHIEAGRTHGGVEYYWQHVRYANLEVIVLPSVDGEMAFKLEDHHRTRYARTLSLADPRVLNYFKLQKLDCQKI